MKTLIPAAIRCSLMFTAVAALSIAYPTSVQAVPTTYQYTGNPFTIVEPPYTTSDFVTVMLTLADPLPANFDGDVTPTAFTVTDGVQTISQFNSVEVVNFFQFVTDGTGAIVTWLVTVEKQPDPDFAGDISTENDGFLNQQDQAFNPEGFGVNGMPGGWRRVATRVPDAGSTLLLMTLTLMALGLVARRFQRAAASSSSTRTRKENII